MDAEQSKIIEALYFEMFDKLLLYARSSMDSEALAEEAIQETFRIACQQPEKVCSSPNPQGWLVNTLHNTVRNMRRNRETAKRIMEQYLLKQYKELSIVEDTIRVEILYDDVADTEEFKLLLEMVVQGRSHAEMAAARGISVSACKKRVERAKDLLQKKLKRNVTHR